MNFQCLITGAILAFLSVLAHAQTLADIQALIKEEKMAQALERVDRYIAAQPKDPRGPFTKGLILNGMGRLQEAIEVFTDLTENFPGQPEPYNNLAVLYAQQKQYDKAQAALEMAIHTHPSYAVAYENLGGLYAKLASQAYDKALQLDSSNRTAPARLSMIRELAGVAAQPGVETVMAPKLPNEPVKTAAAEPVRPSGSVSAPAVVAKPATPPAASGQADETRAAAKADRGKKAETGAGGVQDEIAGIVRDWADAWSRKNVKTYLSFYAGNFQTPNGMALKKWQEERRRRIDRPGRLQVGIRDIKVSVSGDTATARFRQQYVSATFRSLTSKTLVFVKSGNRWLILQERVN
ncbi:MAG: tetratricopeptide repeat protein [Candidatus Accumulibacter sp.]|nr:tetratricopeptide repeat protein [Accumulibacter sp.]